MVQFIPMIVAIASTVIKGLTDKNSAKSAQGAANAVSKQHNKAVIAETARGIGEINRQRTLSKMQTNQALLHDNAEAIGAISNITTQEAALDSIGASSTAAILDVRRQQSEVTATTMLNFEINQDNLDTQLQSLVNSGISQYAALGSGAGAAVQSQMAGQLANIGANYAMSSYSKGVFGGSGSSAMSTGASYKPAFTGSSSLS